MEDLALGSPVHESRAVSRRQSRVGPKPNGLEEEGEDDMEAQLAAAMALADDEPAGGAAAGYESEEDVSEEE